MDLTLHRDENGLSLVGDGQSLRGDFARLLPRIRRGNLQGELLVKAAKIKGQTGGTVMDCTAGLGEDAFLLTAAGFTVALYERDETIAALLRDALDRAAMDPELAPIAARMTFFAGDSIQALQNLPQPPDVIYLDPMFPQRQKSGLVKKKFQLLQQLERPCADGEALLSAALAASPRKIVIKRPLKGENLAGRAPDYSLKGKTIRYDCLVLPKKP
jgi:16S rRNA (guanine1516-N2)-methyltransferase